MSKTTACLAYGVEDRSDIPTAVGIARGGLRANRVADEGGLVGNSRHLHPVKKTKPSSVDGFVLRVGTESKFICSRRESSDACLPVGRELVPMSTSGRESAARPPLAIYVCDKKTNALSNGSIKTNELALQRNEISNALFMLNFRNTA